MSWKQWDWIFEIEKEIRLISGGLENIETDFQNLESNGIDLDDWEINETDFRDLESQATCFRN